MSNPPQMRWLHGGGRTDRQRFGAPPRTGKPASAATSAYLRSVGGGGTLSTDAGVDVSRQRTRRTARKKDREVELAEADTADQVFALKKEILAHKTETAILKGKVNQLKAVVRAKDKQLDDLLEEAEGTVSSAVSSSRTSTTKTASIRLVAQLKSKLVREEQAKEALQAKLDAATAQMKHTVVSELQAEVLVYYNEAMRLQQLLDAEDRGQVPSKAHSRQLAAATSQMEHLQAENEVILGDFVCLFVLILIFCWQLCSITATFQHHTCRLRSLVHKTFCFIGSS
eukprot:m.339308 g.339308  ORF g.339308 m.339308 type:complete len:284 (+) comp16094_c1_seq7:169-1020(+)